LAKGFVDGSEVDVDGFLGYSLQVQNRRKSRMGRALENHLEAAFEAQVRMEAGNTVDFLFPSGAAYRDDTFPHARLTMLASKSTCKDRWRQVLPEAARIWPKHLLTLEPSISVAQTDQMQREQLQLVIPRPVHEPIKSCSAPGFSRWPTSSRRCNHEPRPPDAMATVGSVTPAPRSGGKLRNLRRFRH
jgi:hypothetical protein